MKYAPSLSLGIAACALVVSTLLVATPSGYAAEQQPAGATAAVDDPAASVFSRTCSECHDPERIVSTRRTRPDWEEVLHKMIEKGAKGSEDDFQAVFGYLLRNYGKVYINSALPDEITAIVGLSKKDADAIVAARKANGSFADFEALKKVPDIDVKTLDEHKDAVAF